MSASRASLTELCAKVERNGSGNGGLNMGDSSRDSYFPGK